MLLEHSNKVTSKHNDESKGVNSMSFSSIEREETFNKITNTSLDVLVIGGGITGAGIALDAQTRGMNVAVVEMQDFAAGTSSRSTKLVHGGLRYLKQFEIGIVAEVGKERAIVYENAPHITTPEWMMLPFYKGGTFGPFSTSIGLRVYDFLAGVKKNERRKMLTIKETLELEPMLEDKNLLGAGYYVEYKTDDARLTIEIMKKAVYEGAIGINYAKVVELIYKDNKVIGARIENQINGLSHNIYAKTIVNATGPWVDNLREKDKSKLGKTLYLTKGVHLVFDNKRFPLKQAIYFDTPDKRMVFAIPREGKTYVGTTDTVYDGDIAHPTTTVEDRDYLLKAINFMFPEVNMIADDVESSWSGLRPLILEEGKKPSEISRKDEVFVSDSGLISIAGGKLTGYRKMAETVVDLVANKRKEKDGIIFSEIATKNLTLSGGDVGGSKGFAAFFKRKVEEGQSIGLNLSDSRQLVKRYGSNIDKVYDLYIKGKDKATQEGIDPVIYAVVCYSVEHESAYKPTDIFIRRTGDLFFDIEKVYQFKQSVILYLEKLFNWSKEQTIEYTEELETLLHEAKIQ